MNTNEIKLVIVGTIMLGVGMMWLGDILGRMGL